MTVAFTDRPAAKTAAVGTHRGARTVFTGLVNHWTGTLRPLIREAPASGIYLAALMVTTATLAGSSTHAVHWMVASASTNVHNMTTDPVRVLLVSAFWVQSTPWIWPMAALIVAVMAPAERLLGTGHTLFIFAAGHLGATVLTVAAGHLGATVLTVAAGHLGATVLTVAAVGLGVDRGLFPHHLAYALDVGPSYGLAALAAVLATRLRRGHLRVATVGGLLFGLAIAVILGGDFTDSGHLVAVVIGLPLSRVVTVTAGAPRERGKSFFRNRRGPSASSVSEREATKHRSHRCGLPDA
jgi:hypothetical protein